MKQSKISTIMIGLLLGIFVNNQTITCSEAAAAMTQEQIDAKNAEVERFLSELESIRIRNSNSSLEIIDRAKSAGYIQLKLRDHQYVTEVVREKFEKVNPDLEAQLLLYLTEAYLKTNDQYQPVLTIMKSADYCTATYTLNVGAFPPSVGLNLKVALINNLAYALYKSGNSSAALNLLSSTGLKYLKLNAGKYVLEKTTLSSVNPDTRSELIDTIICILNIKHKNNVADVASIYFNPTTLAPQAEFSKLKKPENKAALCVSIANSFDNPQRVLKLMHSAGYWNGENTFYTKNLKAISSESIRRELCGVFETALQNLGKIALIPALRKAAGLQI